MMGNYHVRFLEAVLKPNFFSMMPHSFCGVGMYPSDLSDAEWEKIESVFRVDYRRGGRPLKYNKREMVNAIFYVAKTGCQWRFLPKDYPPWRRVYNNFRKWQFQ
jgi:hypothetical protein